jgi:hypothetical protein
MRSFGKEPCTKDQWNLVGGGCAIDPNGTEILQIDLQWKRRAWDDGKERSREASSRV